MNFSYKRDPAVRSTSVALVNEAWTEVEESLRSGRADRGEAMAAHVHWLCGIYDPEAPALEQNAPGALSAVVGDLARLLASLLPTLAESRDLTVRELLEIIETSTLDWPESR